MVRQRSPGETCIRPYSIAVVDSGIFRVGCPERHTPCAFEPSAGRREEAVQRGGPWRGCRRTEPGKPEVPSTPSPSSSSLRPFSE